MMAHRRKDVFLFLLFFGTLSSSFCPCSAASKQKELMDTIFADYDPAAMPSSPDGNPLHVTVNLIISKLADVVRPGGANSAAHSASLMASLFQDDQQQTSTFIALVSMSWTDSSLCWNPADHNNITRIVVPAEKIWRPDAYTNSLTNNFFKIDNLAVSLFSGSPSKCFVTYNPAGYWTYTCDFDITKFPFDVQECWIYVGKFVSDAMMITLINASDKVTFLDVVAPSNGLWTIVETTAGVDSTHPAYGERVMFTLKIQRKSLYYLMYIVIPLIIMAMLNVMVFCLPADSGEKVTLSVTVLLAFTIVLITLQGMTPASADSIPILTICTTCLMFASTLGVVFTVFVVRIDGFKEDRPIPRWLIRITNCCSRRRKVTSGVIQVSSPPDSDKCISQATWCDVATSIDRICFYVFLFAESCLIIGGGVRLATWESKHVQPAL